MQHNAITHRRLTTMKNRRFPRLMLTSAFALTLCIQTPAQADLPARSFADMLAKVELLPVSTQDSELLDKVSEAIDYIKAMELEAAHFAVNEALQLDPRNSHLHFLNGFVYHLLALQGDIQKGELALEGYQQSLRIDPSNWISHEFLGLAYLDLKHFEQAKQAFSEALLLNPESEPSIHGLMVSAYLTGDARTACSMADQFLKVSTRPSSTFLQSSIPVYASCGSFARADWVRAALAQEFGETPELKRIDRRLAQWKTFYSDHRKNAAGSLKTKRRSDEANNDTLLLAKAFTVPELARSRPDDLASTEEYVEESNNDYSTEAPDTSMPDIEVDNGPRTLMVDVVLLSTQELMATSKGVNLLNALTLQLGSVAGNLPAYSKVITSNAMTDELTATSTAITRAVTIPALSYSMNIANANSSVNEVLARPTLAAIEGMPSEFFSGTNLSAGVVSKSEEGGTTIVPLEKRFGIALAVTPNFLPEGRIQLKVEAQRTALNASSDNPRVAYQIEIGETTANANVVMNIGETLVLSGLSEKSSSTTRDGVPGLQDVPLLQYFFSNKRTNQLQRSVLILVTPRSSIPISESRERESEPMDTRMQSLREKFGFTDSTPPNIEAVLTQLQGNEHYREFRQSDVSLERWDRVHTTGERLKEALSFLYY